MKSRLFPTLSVDACVCIFTLKLMRNLAKSETDTQFLDKMRINVRKREKMFLLKDLKF